jgi:hypothetical protein
MYVCVLERNVFDVHPLWALFVFDCSTFSIAKVGTIFGFGYLVRRLGLRQREGIPPLGVFLSYLLSIFHPHEGLLATFCVVPFWGVAPLKVFDRTTCHGF